MERKKTKGMIQKKIGKYACKNPRQIEKLLNKAYKTGISSSFILVKSLLKKLAKWSSNETIPQDQLKMIMHILDGFLETNKPVLTPPLKKVAQKLIEFTQEAVLKLGIEQSSQKIEIPMEKAIKFMTHQAQLIKYINTETVQKIKTICKSAHKEGWNFHNVSKAFQEIVGVSKSKAEFWARDQVIKKNVEITNNIIKITKPLGYIWEYSGVKMPSSREEHWVRKGKFFLLDEISEDDQPGVPYNCGCFKVLVYDEKNIPKKDRWKIESKTTNYR